MKTPGLEKVPRPRRARPIIPEQRRVLDLTTSESLQSPDGTARINKRYAISKPSFASKRQRETQQHEVIQSDNLVRSIKNSCGSGCSRVTIPSEVAVMASELAFYKERYQEANEECRILENQQRQIESLGQLPEETTVVLNQNTRKIAILKKKLQDRTNLERYLSFGKAPNAVSNSQRLIDLFHNLKDSIATVLVMDGAKEYPIGSLPGKSADLDGLLSSVFGIDTHCKLEGTPIIFPTLTSFELVQALTGASIYNWVFGAEFQAHEMRTTPLLEEYRSLITTWCGHESLYNLDLAVHRSIIESESFKEVIIPEMSKMFRDRLTDALYPFFSEILKDKAITKLQSSLSAVFKLAVEVRAESLLSANHFELIWPVAGSAANEAEMEATNSNPIADGKVVKSPLFPGLRAFRKGKTMVEYRGLAKGISTGMCQDYVVKALVLS